MVFLLSKRLEILYGTTKIQNKSRQALKISVKVRFPILKLPFFFSFIYCMVWLWQRFWVPVEIFFWIFEVPYKISHLFDNKNTIWLKIYPCFRSQITTCNFPTWPGTPCRKNLTKKWFFKKLVKLLHVNIT